MKLLSENNFHQLLAPLQQVAINSFFARSVVEQKVRGTIYVDDIENAKTFYVLHPYGMSLLFGEPDNSEFNTRFKEYALNIHRVRDRHEWMQAGSGDWDKVLSDLFADRLITSADNTMKQQAGIIELNTRVNFKFHRERFLMPTVADLDVKIVRTDKQIFHDMKGSVVPSYFWNSEDDFLENGVGFSLLYQGKLASTAYASFIHGDCLELGIETVEGFRGNGFAELTCAALIDYCLANNFEPIWACRLENIGSYKLAQKVGFLPSLEIPYYRLSK